MGAVYPRSARRPPQTAILLVATTCLLIASPSIAGAAVENGLDAWLRYRRIADEGSRRMYARLPASVVVIGEGEVLRSARRELTAGMRGMLERVLREERSLPREAAFVIGTADALARAGLSVSPLPVGDGYAIAWIEANGNSHLVVAGGTARGALYGTFALLRKLALRQPLEDLAGASAPAAPVRWVNEWNNLDGTIERGYGGRSLFFANDHVRDDLARAGQYARLLASLGINACSVNNVNADPRLLTAAYRPELARLAAAFRPWGVQLAIAIDFASPQKIGGLDTFDPLDPAAARWWQEAIDGLYSAVPDLAGIVLKADSEGRVGPSAYKRTHADAANVIARPLAPHGGLLFYRGFVYDHHMDWRNLKNDRARAAYDNFIGLDGKFADNVILQIKHGPIDFQVREPVSPLFGALERTNEAIELQITQEYFGQQRHMVFIVPMWKEALDFDLHAAAGPTPVKDVVKGAVFRRPTGGFVGVSNVGLDDTWLGSHLAQANLYGFGRLAWNPDLSSQEVAGEWTRLTFGHDPDVVATITGMLLRSWRTYENYTGPLGLQTLTDIVGPHFGPAVEASERNGWGQWHRADHDGVGMDRTVSTGTGYIGQYRPAVASLYESLDTCPDDLVLFMHHVPYTHVLHSGKTVIQTIYDMHIAGADDAERYVEEWRALEGRVGEPRYGEVLAQLEYQAGHARVWRDAVATWFWKTSGIPDAHGRVGTHPGRIEAEAMTLEGYQPQDVVPWEAASGSRAVACPGARCSASVAFRGEPGWYEVITQYFDQRDGAASFELWLNDQRIDAWRADDHLPSAKLDAHTSTWRRTRGVALRPGDTLRVTGVPSGADGAGLDYIELRPGS